MKTKSEASRLLLVGVIGSLICSGLIELLGCASAAGAKPLVELLVALVLLRRYPEAAVVRWTGGLVSILCIIGLALTLAWVAFFAWGNTRFFDAGSVSAPALAVGMVGAVVTAPIYEEKVVRHLLLQGAAGFIGRWGAALLISVVFGLIHTGAMVWTFLVSLVLCWLALAKGLTSTQRAIVHGTVNAMIMLWYLTRGFGLFP